MTAVELARTLLLELLAEKPAPAASDDRPKLFYPMCRTCGWSMGGLDSWDGSRCKCGKAAIGIPLSEIMKIGDPDWVKQISALWAEQGHPIDEISKDQTKRCALCTRVLPIDEFYRCGTGRHSYCKLCHRDRTLELRAARAERRAA